MSPAISSPHLGSPWHVGPQSPGKYEQTAAPIPQLRCVKIRAVDWLWLEDRSAGGLAIWSSTVTTYAIRTGRSARTRQYKCLTRARAVAQYRP